jgi:hypothetical protein
MPEFILFFSFFFLFSFSFFFLGHAELSGDVIMHAVATHSTTWSGGPC